MNMKAFEATRKKDPRINKLVAQVVRDLDTYKEGISNLVREHRKMLNATRDIYATVCHLSEELVAMLEEGKLNDPTLMKYAVKQCAESGMTDLLQELTESDARNDNKLILDTWLFYEASLENREALRRALTRARL